MNVNDDWKMMIRPTAASTTAEGPATGEDVPSARAGGAGRGGRSAERVGVRLTGRGKLPSRAIRRLALFLEERPENVERNVPAALQEVICRLPWQTRLRRHRDRVVLQDVRFLFERMPPDDLRRARLKFLLEHAERRSRL